MSCHKICAVSVSQTLRAEDVFGAAICLSREEEMMLVNVRYVLSKVPNGGTGGRWQGTNQGLRNNRRALYCRTKG